MRWTQPILTWISIVLVLSILLSITCIAVESSSSQSTSSSSSRPHPHTCRVSSQISSARSRRASKRSPTILFWDTEGVNYEMYGVWFGDESYIKCPVECRIERGRSRSQLARAEAVMFWATPTNKDIDFEEKCEGSLWLQTSTEAFDVRILEKTPPGGLMENGTPSPIDLEVSWRRSLGTEKVSWLNNYDWNMDFVRRTPTAGELNPLTIGTKTRAGRDSDQAAVAAFISNCGAISPRLEIMEELQKYIQIDSYGRCGHNRDVPDHWTEEKDVSRGLLMQKNKILRNRYKFLLAFENQEIDDYVTEKFYHPLGIGVLPIVLGAPNINQFTPAANGQPAFINIKDFASMAELAERIDYLDRNDTAYLEYFKWRSQPPSAYPPLFHSLVSYSWLDSPCQVCQSIHSKLYGWKAKSILPEDWNRRRIQVHEDNEREVERKRMNKVRRAKLEEEDRANDELAERMKQEASKQSQQQIDPSPTQTQHQHQHEEL